MNLKAIFAGVVCLSCSITSFAQNNDGRRQMNNIYKPDILSVAPLQFTENGFAGVGISYEHAIDQRSIVAFYLPVVFEFNLANTQHTANTNKNSDPMFYIMPGIKLYPTGAFSSMAKYAIGPNLVIADGQRTVSNGSYYSPPYNFYSVEDHFLIGMIINQSVNINPTPWLYIGSEFGIGFSYVDRVGGSSIGVQTLVNFNFKLGFRF